MTPFQYLRADTIADAVRMIAAKPGAKFVAGGTNLVDLMKMDVERSLTSHKLNKRDCAPADRNPLANPNSSSAPPT